MARLATIQRQKKLVFAHRANIACGLDETLLARNTEIAVELRLPRSENSVTSFQPSCRCSKLLAVEKMAIVSNEQIR